MDKYAGKRIVGGTAPRGPGVTSRDKPNHENRSTQCCNRLGCSTRNNSMKGIQIGGTDTYNKPNLSVRSRGGSKVGSSSKTYSSLNDVRKPNKVSAETRKMQMEKDVSDNSSTNSEQDDAKSVDINGNSSDRSQEVSTSNEASNTRTQKLTRKRSVLENQVLSPNTSSRRSFAPRNTTQAAKPASNGQGSSSRYGLKNLGCASISDVLPGCSSSEPSRSKTAVAAKRSSVVGLKGKTLSGSSSGENSGNRRNVPSGSTISLSESSSSQQSSRRTRNWPRSRESIVTSVRTRRTTNEGSKGSFSEDSDDNNTSDSDPHVATSELSHTELLVGQSSSSRQFPLMNPTGHRNSYERPGSSNGNRRIRQISPPDDDGLRLFNGLSLGGDGFRRFNMDGIAEVLLALDRIEQDEELTYEQLLTMEANLFLGGISFHDQHRDMRLDIDNMSYEELLALEEKMGNVSVGLTEEATLKCLKKSFYMNVDPDERDSDYSDDDVKCSICQEEYVDGDEVGKLQCDHRYHVACVKQWLHQKNLCPICKSPAAAS